jgi:hypothetical protein
MMDEDKAKLVEGIGIYMLAIFELQNTDLDGAPLFIKGMMEISFRNSPDGMSCVSGVCGVRCAVCGVRRVVLIVRGGCRWGGARVVLDAGV